MKNPTGIKLCISHKIATSRGRESRGGRPRPFRPIEPYGFCGRKEILNSVSALVTFLIDDRLIEDHLYSAILRSLEQTHCARLWFYMSDKLFMARFLNIHRSGVLTALAWLVPHETAAISAQALCTPYNHAQCHFMQSHIRKVYACLAVTCHLHFWRNDRDLLRATAVTRGWNGYRN